MAGGGAGCTACRWDGGHRDGEESGRRKAMGLSGERIATYNDGLFPTGKNTGTAVVVFPGGAIRLGLFVPPPERGKRLLLGIDFVEGVALEEFTVFHHVLDRI